MVIKILGSGCKKCKKLEENARDAVAKMGIDAEIQKVTAMSDIMGYGVMSTPALVVDDVVKASGQVLNVKQIVRILE
jgi:small redox-active disulfide protein 2